MRIALRFRERVQRLGSFLTDEFDGMAATISATWELEHQSGDGGHTDVTLRSLTSNREDYDFVQINSGLRFMTGPWQCNEQGDPGYGNQGVIFVTTGSVHNWAPPGIGPAIGIVVTIAAAVDITGITAIRHTRLMFLLNRSDYTLTLKHNSSSSEQEHRFNCPSGGDFAIPEKGGVWLLYNAHSREWNILSI